MREFGGITGDLAGWFLQICELISLCASLFFMRMGHPTKEELAAARDFAVRCAKG